MEYNNCKFGSYCKFSHDLITINKHIEEIDKVKKQIEGLEKEIAEKDAELRQKDEEIKKIEQRMIIEKAKILEVKEDEIVSLTKENLEMKNKVEELEEKNKSLVIKGMLFDIFKIEMRERYGHVEEESDDDEEFENTGEIDKVVDSEYEKQGFQCDQCTFFGKTESGLKTHKTVKHKGKIGSSSV